MKRNTIRIILMIIFLGLIWSLLRIVQYDSLENLYENISTATYEEGLTLYTKEIEKHPYNYNVYFRRGMRKLNNSNNIKENIQNAIMDLNKAITINPMNTEYYINKIKALKTFPDFTGAIEVASHGLQYDKNNQLLLFQRASLYHVIGGTGNNQLALEDYNTVLKRGFKNPETYKLKGDILQSLGRFPEAIKSYNKAIEIDPLYYNAYIQAANLETLLGNYYNALEYYTTLIGLKNNEYFNNSNNLEVSGIKVKDVLEEIYKGRSNIYKLLGETQKAKEDFLEGDKYCFVGSEHIPCSQAEGNKDKFTE